MRLWLPSAPDPAHQGLDHQVQEQAAQLEEWNRTLAQRVGAQLAEIERLGSLKRFLAPQIAELVLSTGGDSLLESHRREITVVFCEMPGFTAFAETSEPEEVMGVLRQYHEALGKLIFQHEGTVQDFAGDGVVVLFDDPLPCPDPSARAVRMAIAMRARIAELRGGLAQAGPRPWLRSCASRRATPRSAGSASRAASTTPRSARSRTWPRACATRRATARS